MRVHGVEVSFVFLKLAKRFGEAHCPLVRRLVLTAGFIADQGSPKTVA
jgi:hypothetical protein